jgi:hypothetical protein
MKQAASSRVESSRQDVAREQPASGGSAVFYRYRNPSGRLVIVDSLEQVPAGEREHAERVVLGAPAGDGVRALKSPLDRLDLPSFAAGFGLALALATIVLFVTRGSFRWLAFLLVLAVVVGGSAAYFGWLRRASGQDTAVLASPRALIDDAKRAVEAAKERQREQERVIRDIQREAK